MWNISMSLVYHSQPVLENIMARVKGNTFQKKMFQDLKSNIYHPIFTIFGVIKDNGGFNPKPLKFRDFSVLSATEHAQIVWKLQRQLSKGKHQP